MQWPVDPLAVIALIGASGAAVVCVVQGVIMCVRAFRMGRLLARDDRLGSATTPWVSVAGVRALCLHMIGAEPRRRA